MSPPGYLDSRLLFAESVKPWAGATSNFSAPTSTTIQRSHAMSPWRAGSRFFVWCENRGLSIIAIRPFDAAAWVKELQGQHGTNPTLGA